MLSLGATRRKSNRARRRDHQAVPARKRKVQYPPAKTATRGEPRFGAGGEAPTVRTTVASINMNAIAGKQNLNVGQKVRIVAAGLYSGESAVIERFTGGVIPSALVRTDAGRTRQVRTIDLEPIA
jgi:hypothetical protein